MNEQEGKPPAAIIFVHGFGSSSRCWDHLITLLESDKEVTKRFAFYRFDYPTSWLKINPLERIPDHSEIAHKIEAYLDSDQFRNRELFLVGHSQGGLLIHAFLSHMVSSGKGEQLEAIRQVITIATPHTGSFMLHRSRNWLSWIFHNPQEERLRPLDEKTSNAVRIVKDRIATTVKRDSSHWPIPVHCFGGLTDNVVPSPSARGPFSCYTAISGNHFSVLQPANTDDDRYREFKEILLDPTGHPHVFEIEHYETTIVVHPVERKSYTVDLGKGLQREIVTDNICELVRTVRFANNNRCSHKFKIRYLTGKDSCFETHESHENEASYLKSEYRTGEKIDYLFTPKQKSSYEKYSLDLKVFNGYDPGRTDIHFHLGPESTGAKAYYRKLTYTLDLSHYLASRQNINTPSFYFHHRDPGNCGECKNKRKIGAKILPTAEPRNGVWRWELNNVRQGVTDLVWEL